MTPFRWMLLALVLLAVAFIFAGALWASIECMGQPERAEMDFLVRLVDCS